LIQKDDELAHTTRMHILPDGRVRSRPKSTNQAAEEDLEEA